MHTEIDPENELLQLVVEELVRAALRTPLREPILTAVESTSAERVEVVVPEGSGDAASIDEVDDATGDTTGDAGSADAESDAAEKGPVAKAAKGLVVFAVTFTVLYLALRRLTD